MSNQDLIVSDNNRQVQRLDHAGMPADIAEELRHDEEDIWRYLDDLDNTHLKLAFTLKKDHDIYARRGNNWTTEETWVGYVGQFYPKLSFAGANQLVKIAEKLLGDEATRLSLPDSIRDASRAVQYQYAVATEETRQRIGAPAEEGGIPLNSKEIAAANLIAQKAETRAREVEAALAKSLDELARIEATRQQAEKTLEYALMESENARLKLAEQEREMKSRIAEATTAERERLENSYKAALYRAETDLKKTREDAEKNLKKANADLREARQLSQDLTERLKVSRDRGAIWTRWEINSVKFAKQIEQIIAELPPEEEMVVYEEGHWQLLQDMVKRVDTLSDIIHERLDRHARGEGNVVDAN